MWGLAKIIAFGLVAILVGVAAVSLPIGGSTPAEYVRGFFEAHLSAATVVAPGGSPSAQQKPESGAAAKAQPARSPTRVAPTPAADRPPADDHTDEDRAALEKLLNERIR